MKGENGFAMSRPETAGAVLGLILAVGSARAAPLPLIDVSFESHELGSYTDAQVRKDWKDVRWVGLHNRARIVRDPDTKRGKVLRVAYPEGSVGPGEGGGQFEVRIPPHRDLWFSYWVKFGEGFDFKLGGKLPGLTSGGSTYTGGRKPSSGEGWSARYMWMRNGGAMVYLYHVDMPGRWGESLPLRKGFTAGVWHRITQHIQVNTPGKRDGMLIVWLDGEKVLDRSDLRYRTGEKGLIDSVYFSTFHGGNSEAWAPDRPCVAFFDDFHVSLNLPPE